VGYGVGGAGWVAAIDAVRQPFNTNALGQAAALESLRHPGELARRTGVLIEERGRLERELTARGIEHAPSQANFLLVTPDARLGPDPSAVHEQLLRLGVIVRDGAALGCPGRIRVSIGTPDENTVLLDALASLAGRVTSTPTGRAET
jgi:histidinol-phosphate aminotransferase